MHTEKDIVALVELLKMADERWPHVGIRGASLSDLLAQDRSLLEMWPQACERTGGGKREFPPEVIKLWKERLGRAN
jgi:hypothetical protein